MESDRRTIRRWHYETSCPTTAKQVQFDAINPRLIKMDRVGVEPTNPQRLGIFLRQIFITYLKGQQSYGKTTAAQIPSFSSNCAASVTFSSMLNSIVISESCFLLSSYAHSHSVADRFPSLSI